tara:strand:- start:14 stop:754 length:741 start_codon:yes stop_codon:yes gene_type:complete
LSEVTISIVSHGNAKSIEKMLMKSNKNYFSDKFEIIIRENKFKTSKILNQLSRSQKNIKLFYNSKCFGFGKNHNLNFKESSKESKSFVVCNPDLKKLPDNFEIKRNSNKFSLVSAKILNKNGGETDSLRSEISISKLFLRLFRFKKIGLTNQNDPRLWTPNVFIIFSKELFMRLNGYDENIFMYYEDYDICMRAKPFCKLIINNNLKVNHFENRASRRNFKLFFSHIKSSLYVISKKRSYYEKQWK